MSQTLTTLCGKKNENISQSGRIEIDDTADTERYSPGRESRLQGRRVT